MSSKLKKKSKKTEKFKRYMGITKKTAHIIDKCIKEDNAVKTISVSLSYMTHLALLDVLGYKAKRAKRFQEKMLDMSAKRKNDQITIPELLYYCEKKNIRIEEWLKSIPNKQKIALCPFTITTKEWAENMELEIQTHGVFCAVVLKEHFGATLKEIHAVLEHIKGSISCYATLQPKIKKPYLTDDDIKEVFRDELKLDLETGEKNHIGGRRCF